MGVVALNGVNMMIRSELCPVVELPGGLAEKPKSAPADGETEIPKTNHGRVLYARDLAHGLHVECAEMCRVAQRATVRRERLHHAIQIARYGGTTINFPHEHFLVANAIIERMGVIQWAAGMVEKLTGQFTDAYDGHSAGVHQIGPLVAPHAHGMAVMLARRLFDIYMEHGSELLGTERDDKMQEVVTDEDIRHSEEWYAGTRRFRDRLLALIGEDFDQQYERWIADVRVEAGRVLKVLPREQVALSDDPQKVIDTLKAAGRRLTTDQLVPKLTDSPEANSSKWKSVLSNMVKLEIITNKRDGRGKGYGLPEWDRTD